ncbi:MAG TPA: MerR family transcriptional regulator [Thermoanaerobaculia bacterium]|nr:MerR family transcriptional regulator [Thermoanaerobaculia bacterium]
MRRGGPPGLSIAAVSRQTGIPVTTLRFYERELPGLFQIRKTRGGHRRYGPTDIVRFAAVRRLTETGGVKLSEVRRATGSRDNHEPLRDDLERFRLLLRDQSQGLEELFHRVGQLEARLRQIQEISPRRRRWLR